MSHGELVQMDSVGEIVPIQSEIGRLIQVAIEKDLDLEKLERLLEMKRVDEDRESKRAFLKAKSKFQSECPSIPHDKQATTPHATWTYASLGLICETIRPFLAPNGLSHRWEGEGEEMRCYLTHKDGHSESAAFTLSIDGQKGGLANMTQQMRQGAADTYAKGRTLCAVCGIGTAQQDTGGVGSEDFDEQTGKEEAEKIQRDWLKPCHELHEKSKAEKQRRFAAWFLENTDAKVFTPVVTRWTDGQLADCRKQLEKEAKAREMSRKPQEEEKEDVDVITKEE